MSTEPSPLDTLVNNAMAAIALREEEAPNATISMRERFLELLVLTMANLYSKMPVASAMFDRIMLKSVTQGLEDNEAGKLSTRSEDWIRLEGLVRVLEGQKSYTLNRPAMAVLSTLTPAGTLGEVMEKITARYVQQQPSAELRRCTRLLASYFMMRLGRS